jgi:hypothetical protein
MARQTVRQNLTAMDVRRPGTARSCECGTDAIMEPDTVVDDDQERLDGYDLDENFSDDE